MTKTKPLVLVTGPSGAGRSTAIKALEDLGFEAIDNLPLRLFPRLLEAPEHDRPMVLGVDTRNRDFSADALLDTIRRASDAVSFQLTILYLDCRADVLLRRYSETRRRHPLAPDEAPELGIARDQSLLLAVRAKADVLIDTSDMNIHQLREEVERLFSERSAQGLAVSVQSFSYKRGLPRGLDLVFDCRFLQNPHWQAALKALDGRNAAVADFVKSDPLYAPFYDKVLDLLTLLLPAYQTEGKAHLSVGFGCTGGQHRSVALAETMSNSLAQQGWQVSIRHLELERHTTS